MDDVEELKRRICEFRITFTDDPPASPAIPGLIHAHCVGHEWSIVVDSSDARPEREVKARFPDARVAVRSLGLQDIFVALQRAADTAGEADA